MAFTLKVAFTGLCLYVKHSNGKQVRVLLPDARDGLVDPEHSDGSTGEAHVGYVRFNLANLDPDFPSTETRAAPSYEVIHRLDRERVRFEPMKDEPITDLSPNVPEFEEIGGDALTLRASALNPPHEDVVGVATISGGSLVGERQGNIWHFSTLFTPDRPEPYADSFAGEAIWVSEIDGHHVDVYIERIDDNGVIRVRLRPAPGEDHVFVRVANLCATNPLEWDELELFTTDKDRDFKWLYRLFDVPADITALTEEEPSALGAAAAAVSATLTGGELPFPVLRDAVHGEEDCMGGQIRQDF